MEMKKDFPQFHTQRLILRQFQPTDIEHVFKGLSHEEVIKYYGVSYRTLQETKEQMDWYANLEKEGTGIWWAITSAEDGTFFGAAGFNNLSKEHRKAEIGFWLLPEFQKKGIIQEAVPVIIQHAFEELQLHRIEAYVETENSDSAKALQKLHFAHEGRLKECEIKNGRFISLDIFARLKSK